MTETFAGLGIPFPLFEAPVREVDAYVGVDDCTLCRRSGNAFTLGIGDEVIVRCARCRELTAVDADDRETPCIECSEPVRLSVADDAEILCCYSCLRSGAAAMTKDTPLGMIRWEDARRGRTHGTPGPSTPREYPAVFVPDGKGGIALNLDPPPPIESNWIEKELPKPVLFELLRTPDFQTWQGSKWLFDGTRPMIYVGRWARRQFREQAPDGDGEQLFRSIALKPPSEPWSGWVGEDLDDPGIGVYVFRSATDGRLAANWDLH